MPERPDLEYQIPLIDAAIAGRTIVEARVHDPVVVRRAVKGELPELLAGWASNSTHSASASSSQYFPAKL